MQILLLDVQLQLLRQQEIFPVQEVFHRQLPIALTFGNPYNPEVYWQFVNAIKGMGAACIRFETPVTGGNVSFYNQSVINGEEVPVFPTPTIGMIGILEDRKR